MKIVVSLLVAMSCTRPPASTTPTTSTSSPSGACADEAALAAQAQEHQAWFETLSAGVDAAPVDRELAEDTNGTLQVGFDGGALPVLAGEAGVHVAATTLGKGRVVAFSGQDFLSSGSRSTLLDDDQVSTLLRNAVTWVGGEGPLELLVANDAVGGVLTATTSHTATTTQVRETAGLREIRDWSAAALEGHHVAVVQVNEWGTLMLADDDVSALRTFVESGGGLLVAGSALHWTWWLADQGPVFPGDALLADAGISWSVSSHRDMTTASLRLDEWSSPEALWCAYVSGGRVPGASLGQVGPLFSVAHATGRDQEVNAGLARLVSETPPLPASSSNPEARLAADVGVSLQGAVWPDAHPWAATFPGEVDASVPRVSRTVEVDGRWKRDQALGAYAAPGDVVTVTIAEALAGTGLAVRVGNLHDDLRPVSLIREWRRAPTQWTTIPLEAAVTHLGTGLGGALWLVVPDDAPDDVVEVALEQVVPMAVYRHEQTSVVDFATDVRAGAPQAVVEQAGGVRLVVPAAQAAEADVAEVMDFWGPFYARHADLSQEPSPRRWSSTWLFDPQVGYGYANATPARINHPQVAAAWALKLTPEEEVDYWLFGHELGHQFQTSDWTGGDVTEVCVNLWTMYTLNTYVQEGDDFAVDVRFGPLDHGALNGMTWGEADLFGKLQLYRQLVGAFGWPTLREVMASYHDPAYPRETYGSFMDGFALRMSAISERDLTEFLDRWQYPMSAEARARIQGWGLAPWLPPGW